MFSYFKSGSVIQDQSMILKQGIGWSIKGNSGKKERRRGLARCFFIWKLYQKSSKEVVTSNQRLKAEQTIRRPSKVC